MKFLTAISLLLAVTPSLTHPTHYHKPAPNITITDIDILQYALTLEHLGTPQPTPFLTPA